MSNVYSLHYKLVVTPDVTNGFCCVQCRRCTIFSSVRFFPTSYPKAARFQQLTTWSESETWAGLPRSCCDDEYCSSSSSVVPERSSSRYYKTRGEAREEEKDREVNLSLRETEAKRSGREAGKEMVQFRSMLYNWDRYSFGGCGVVVERGRGREFCERESERERERERWRAFEVGRNQKRSIWRCRHIRSRSGRRPCYCWWSFPRCSSYSCMFSVPSSSSCSKLQSLP